MSGGQKQRLAIARTMSFDPHVVLYDEPTSGLDQATGVEVAGLIQKTHRTHGKTTVIVTHDYLSLAGIADCIYLLDANQHSLEEVPAEQWDSLETLVQPPPHHDSPPPEQSLPQRAFSRTRQAIRAFLENTTDVLQAVVTAPLYLAPIWRSGYWGIRYLTHYLWVVAGPSAMVYVAIAGLIAGFVTTYFTFRFLPYAHLTEPLLVDDVLSAMGFALYRILVPVLATVLIAARCGAAVASDVGGKSYGGQLDAMRTLGMNPKNYLLTPILYAFLVGAPLLTFISYQTAALTSQIVFASTQPQRGVNFWREHYAGELSLPGQTLYYGSGWLLAKLLCCAIGIALLAYYQGIGSKQSPNEVSQGVTSTILWSTLFVLLVHFAFAFIEF